MGSQAVRESTGMVDVGQVAKVLCEADRLIISTHVHPDGDAISSELALAWILRSEGIEPRIVNQSSLPVPYRFLPGIEWLEQWDPSHELACDTFAILDCGRRERVGAIGDRIRCDRVVNIDHHISNDRFGDVNWVVPEACSTGELMVDLADHLGVSIGTELATCLYTAILTDTGNFNFSNTNARSHHIASRLIECGANPAEISRNLYRSRTVGKLRLQARLIDNLRLNEAGDIAWAQLSRQMCEEVGVDLKEALDLVTIPLSVDGVRLGILFRELDERGKTKVSFRSEGDPDVSVLATQLGGGGHPTASGCTLEMDIDEALERVIPAIFDWVDRRYSKTSTLRLRESGEGPDR